MPYTAGEIILDKYRVEALLGQGAFGEVYRVMHTRLLVTRALKVLRKDMPGMQGKYYAEVQERFLLESRLGASVNSPFQNPHLLQVFDTFISEEISVLEMEYLSGGSLQGRMEASRESGKPMPVQDVLQIGMEVASGLGALHKLEIVHRDVKPANILFDERGHAHLSDLGLAQVRGGASQRSQLSAPRLHPGTPEYMSPEQESLGAYLSPASDIYALGLVLFEALTGKGYRSVRPGTRASQLRGDVPQELDDLLVRMLAKNPEERPWDGAEAAELLRHVSQAGEAAARLKAEVEKSTAGAAEKLRAETLERERREKEELARKTAEAAETARRAEIKERERFEREELERKNAEVEERARQVRSGEPTTSHPGMLRYWPAGLVLIGVALLAYLGGRGGFAAVQSLPTRTESPTLAASPVPVQTRAKDGVVEVYVPAGSFTMGSNDGNADEKPAHPVDLPAYWIDRTDVTNAMFAKFASEQGYTTDAEKNGSGNVLDISKSQWNQMKGADWQHPRGPGSSLNGLAEHPVVQVSWNDAAAYCAWAGGRLPTEKEWEKAARGESGLKYPWGDQAPTGELANFADKNLAVDWAVKTVDDGWQFTSPVGNYPKGASPYGALDMAGNVFQWTADWYDVYPGGDPKAATDFGTTARVLRGGSWYYNDYSLRSSSRFEFDPSVTVDSVGFRCARGTSPSGGSN